MTRKPVIPWFQKCGTVLKPTAGIRQDGEIADQIVRHGGYHSSENQFHGSCHISTKREKDECNTITCLWATDMEHLALFVVSCIKE